MELLIIRHGQSHADILKVHEGRADFSLTDCGLMESEAMAKYVKEHFNVNKIYASPLRRAKQSAETLAKYTSATVTFEDDLMEYNNGLLAGLTVEEAALRYPEVKTADNESIYEKESKDTFSLRCKNILKKIIDENSNDSTIAIVTHSGVINEFYKACLSTDKDSSASFASDDTGIHHWQITDGQISIVKANLSQHIDEVLTREKCASKKTSTAFFAGGCFWCITPIFKVYKADKCLCGYSGGSEVNPVYADVKAQKTSHRETIAVEYNQDNVSYDKLVDIFLANVDPFDKDGQFIDRGHSYTLAIYYTCENEKDIALKKIKALEEKSGKKAYIAVEQLKNFYEAETYHQDYYLKNPEAFEQELISSGRKKV